jgi:hypothetical protein
LLDFVGGSDIIKEHNERHISVEQASKLKLGKFPEYVDKLEIYDPATGDIYWQLGDPEISGEEVYEHFS